MDQPQPARPVVEVVVDHRGTAPVRPGRAVEDVPASLPVAHGGPRCAPTGHIDRAPAREPDRLERPEAGIEVDRARLERPADPRRREPLAVAERDGAVRPDRAGEVRVRADRHHRAERRAAVGRLHRHDVLARGHQRDVRAGDTDQGRLHAGGGALGGVEDLRRRACARPRRDPAERDRLAAGLLQVPRDEGGPRCVDLHGRRLARARQARELRRRRRGEDQQGREHDQHGTAHRRMVAADAENSEGPAERRPFGYFLGMYQPQPVLLPQLEHV